ncbi:hypothetical protein [Actinoallomurus sp. CA-150999]|uniref:hypothetical protein n=1 Tax=Actinoallomurus sp. CA-150999 TaxID=3239887 RepID=UPI003D9167DA
MARVWLVSGAVVATLAAAVSSDAATPAPSVLSLPKYVVSVTTGGQAWAQVLRGKTFRAFDAVPAPSPGAGRATAVVAAIADRTFVVAAFDPKSCVSRLYRLRLTEQGRPEVPRPIPGGPIHAAVAGLAVGPDDSKIAFTTASCADTVVPRASVTVLNVVTRERRTWSLGAPSVVGDLTWGSDGRTLGYALGEGVPDRAEGFALTSGTLRSLDTTAGETSLLAGRVVFRPADGVLESATLDSGLRTGTAFVRDTRSGARKWFSFGHGRSPRLIEVIPANTLVAVATRGAGRRHECGGDIDAFGRLIDGHFTPRVLDMQLECGTAS